MKILILAAGYAVRLRPLTLNTPKPLLEVGKRKILDRIIDRLETLADIESISVITNERFYGNFKQWSETAGRKARIDIINDGTTTDENKLGAIGDMRLFASRPGADSEVMVIAGDNIFEFGMDKFLEFGRANGDHVSIAVHDINDRDLARKYGVVETEEGTRRVKVFEEKPENPKGTLVATCVYYFPKGKLGLIEKYFESSEKHDAPGNFIKWLMDNDAVYGFVFDEDWYDIGSLESYKEADRRYLKKP
ncbi:nucleotidyltransferase family protein [Candidatus Omnitrophota bacterium]